MKFRNFTIISFLFLTTSIFSIEFPNSTVLKSIITNETYPPWMSKQINEDLGEFNSIVFSKTSLSAFWSTIQPWQELVHIKIVNGQLFTNNLGTKKNSLLTKRFQILTAALRFLSQVVPLPDVDCMCTLHDFYWEREAPIPIWSFAKNKSFHSVLIPDPEILEGYGYLNRQMQQGGAIYSWPKKVNVGFWRGSTTGGHFEAGKWKNFPRSRLVLLSLQYPHLINARFTNLCQGAQNNPEMKISGIKGNHTPPKDSLLYKYLIDVDGNSCCYSRSYWTLLSNSVVLKQVSDNIQWFYKGLKPYEHYIPLATDCSDIVEKIHWAISHDMEAREIAGNATRFVLQNLQLEHAYAYLYLLLKTSAELQNKTK